MNLKLRDYYSSLSDLCDDLELDEEDIKNRLESIGYNYDKEKNQFK